MPINIHGKDYITVSERLTKAHNELKKITITTEVLFTDPVVVKATVITDKGTFTGISAANPSKQLEKESPWEISETSAVGRALAFAGYETTNGIASAEEMIKLSKINSPEPLQQTKTTMTINGKCEVCGGPVKSPFKICYPCKMKQSSTPPVKDIPDLVVEPEPMPF